MEELLVLLAAFMAGLLGALIGIGGGVILVPTFTLLLGMDVKVAAATSLASLVATSAISSSAYLRRGLVNLRLAVLLEMVTILGSITGASLALIAPSWLIELMLGVALAYATAAVVFKALRAELPRRVEGLVEHSYYDEALNASISYTCRRLKLTAALSFLAGMLSGMLGIGGGVLKVPILDLVAGLPLKAAVATSSYMIGITASAGSTVYVFKGLIRPYLVALSITGIVLGAKLGTRIMVRLRSKVLRVLLATVLAYYSYRMIIRGLRDYGL